MSTVSPVVDCECGARVRYLRRREADRWVVLTVKREPFEEWVDVWDGKGSRVEWLDDQGEAHIGRLLLGPTNGEQKTRGWERHICITPRPVPESAG